ncbi:glutamate [NMDA] receptor subunit 1-like [Macrobrachium rosenbergii]|uniref:glutamate [NMDA] receptor subunit 1-like n=1 Tax=Macrobrachium rosenbergii TaxID=79674 RepID=UPI0034D6F743
MYVGYKLGNGSYTGLVGKVFRGEVDMTGLGFSFTPERFEDMEISQFLYMDEVTAAYRLPTTSSNITGFSNPFVVSVWIVMFAALVFVSVICCLVDYAYPRIISGKWNSEHSHEIGSGAQMYQQDLQDATNLEKSSHFGENLAQAVTWVLGMLLSQSLPKVLLGDSVRV